jgi:hypothetical protein
VRESVARYKADIRYWEVWNEENIEFFRGGISHYVDLLKAASITARQADPEARIVFGGTAGVDSRFIECCYELGAAPYFDVMAVHPYQWGRTLNDGWNRQKVEGLREVMARYGHGEMPVWFTEIGWSTGEGVSNEDQARLLVQSYVSSLALSDLGVAKVFWFCVKDWGGPGHGLFAEDGSPKPAFAAYATLTDELEGTYPLGRVEAGEVRCHAFVGADGGQAVLVLWSPTLEPMPLELPALPNMLVRVSMYGQQTSLAGTDLPHLIATPEPTYLRLPATALEVLREGGRLARGAPQAYRRPVDRPTPPPWWASVQIPDTTSRLCLVPGALTEVRASLWNLGDDPTPATLALALLGDRGKPLASAEGRYELGAKACTPVALELTPPAGLASGLVPMQVTLRAEADPRVVEYRLPVRIAPGPTVEFLGNSHVERSRYLQPGHRSGCAESCRFGAEWTYAFDVPFACRAELQAQFGAHMAGPFGLLASQDGENWQTALGGRGDRVWRDAHVPDLRPGRLWLRVTGPDAQLGELVLTWVR